MTIEMIRQFECADDEGNRHTVQEWQKFTIIRPLSGNEEKVPGARSMRTREGLRVNIIDEDTFQIVQTDAIIRRLR